MDSPSLYQMKPVSKYKNNRLEVVSDPIVIETQLNIVVNDVELATLVTSPAAYQELAIGYLLSEGILNKYADLLEISCDNEAKVVKVYTAEPLSLTDNACYRQVNTCAGKGKQGLDLWRGAMISQPIDSTVQHRPEQFFAMLERLENQCTTFHLTGGTHSAALGCQGELLMMYEDIGRHNAVDKVLGYAFLNQIPLDDKCLVLSGRVAAEILLKAAHSNMPLVLSRSASTLRAVNLAEQLGITVVGFARGERFNVYSHPERIKI